MQNLWGNLIPQTYKTDGAKATEAFNAEFDTFCAEQNKIKAEKEVKKQAEEKPQSITEDIGSIPSEEVVEKAYKALDITQEILDAEKADEEAAIKESKKRRSKKVIEETASDETETASDETETASDETETASDETETASDETLAL